MTTPRTIAACEVRPNSRISVSIERGLMERHISGPVNAVDTVDGSTWITFRDNRSEEMDAKHPVTVLAEPEPEWVEGAWYRCQIHITSNGVKTLRCCVNGWSSFEQGPGSYGDDQVTVLGRVLIVDWPGDDVARDLVEAYSDNRDDFTLPANQMATKVADAIRTQGGVR